jgi:hypothetical protein
MPKVIEPKVVDASEVTGEAPGRPSTAAGSPVRFPSAAPRSACQSSLQPPSFVACGEAIPDS